MSGEGLGTYLVDESGAVRLSDGYLLASNRNAAVIRECDGWDSCENRVYGLPDGNATGISPTVGAGLGETVLLAPEDDLGVVLGVYDPLNPGQHRRARPGDSDDRASAGGRTLALTRDYAVGRILYSGHADNPLGYGISSYNRSTGSSFGFWVDSWVSQIAPGREPNQAWAVELVGDGSAIHLIDTGRAQTTPERIGGIFAMNNRVPGP